MRTGPFVSIWLLALLSIVKVKPSVAYDLRTSRGKSLYTNAAYPFYVRIVFRFLWVRARMNPLGVIEAQACQRAIATYVSLKYVSGSEDVIEINSVGGVQPSR